MRNKSTYNTLFNLVHRGHNLFFWSCWMKSEGEPEFMHILMPLSNFDVHTQSNQNHDFPVLLFHQRAGCLVTSDRKCTLGLCKTDVCSNFAIQIIVHAHTRSSWMSFSFKKCLLSFALNVSNLNYPTHKIKIFTQNLTLCELSDTLYPGP